MGRDTEYYRELFLDMVRNRPFSGYDHNLISFRLHLNQPVFLKQTLMVRNIKKLDPKEFHERFVPLKHQIDQFQRVYDVDEKVKIFTDMVLKVLDDLTPVRKITIANRHRHIHQNSATSS